MFKYSLKLTILAKTADINYRCKKIWLRCVEQQLLNSAMVIFLNLKTFQYTHVKKSRKSAIFIKRLGWLVYFPKYFERRRYLLNFFM